MSVSAPQTMQKYSHVSQSGFTLLELIVALAIFAVIGVGAQQVLSRTVASQQKIEQQDARLAKLQRGMWVIAQDLRNLIYRPIRNEYYSVEPAISTLESGTPLTFTRSGWLNPLNENRSDLQRVSYRLGTPQQVGSNYTSKGLAQQGLIRRYWDYLDRTSDTPYQDQLLIDDVQYLEFSFLDHRRIPHSHWPPSGSVDKATSTLENQETLDGDVLERNTEQQVNQKQTIRKQPLPAAIIIRLGTEHYGEITRTFVIAEPVGKS